MEKALICITTCNRPQWVKKLAPAYIDFWMKNPDRYQFLLAIDGNDGRTINWAKNNNVPHIYSIERKGVSISRNRVIQNFSNFGYYFFIDDDIILHNEDVFEQHIEAFKKTGIHHFNLGADEKFAYRKKKKDSNGYKITQSYIGTGGFLFYTQKAFEITGYYHPLFGIYKRYGHTEHSFRAFRNRLCPSPFCKLDHCEPHITQEWPESVTKHDHSKMKAPFGIAQVEKDLIDEEIYFVSEYPEDEVYIHNISECKRKSFKRFQTLLDLKSLASAVGLYFNKQLDPLRKIKRKFVGHSDTGNSYNF